MSEQKIKVCHKIAESIININENNEKQWLFLSICSGECDFEAEIINYIEKKTKRPINIILYDVLYDTSHNKKAILNKFPKSCCVIFTKVVSEIGFYILSNYYDLTALIGFNIQEAYGIPLEYSKSYADVVSYINKCRKTKSLSCLCDMLNNYVYQIEQLDIYIYKGLETDLDLEYNNYLDFEIDIKKNKK